MLQTCGPLLCTLQSAAAALENVAKSCTTCRECNLANLRLLPYILLQCSRWRGWCSQLFVASCPVRAISLANYRHRILCRRTNHFLRICTRDDCTFHKYCQDLQRQTVHQTPSGSRDHTTILQVPVPVRICASGSLRQVSEASRLEIPRRISLRSSQGWCL